MSVESINEPGTSELVSTTPPSINEPPPASPEEPGGGEALIEVSAVSPVGCAIGDAPLTLHLIGKYFTDQTLVVFDSVAAVTTMISDTELTTELDPGAFVEARDYPVTAQLGGYTAPNPVVFTVTTGAAARREPFVSMH